MLKIENLNVYLEGSPIVKDCSLEIKKRRNFQSSRCQRLWEEYLD